MHRAISNYKITKRKGGRSYVCRKMEVTSRTFVGKRSQKFRQNWKSSLKN